MDSWLSEPMLFNDIGDNTCKRLRFNGDALGYVGAVMRAGDSLVVEQCIALGERRIASRDGLDRVEGCAKGWFLAQPGIGELQPIELEGMDHSSRRMPCGDGVAYWVSNDLPRPGPEDEYFAYVGDLVSNEILRRQYLGEARLATDYPFHLPAPVWNRDCSDVLFDDPRYFEPVSIQLCAPGATAP